MSKEVEQRERGVGGVVSIKWKLRMGKEIYKCEMDLFR